MYATSGATIVGCAPNRPDDRLRRRHAGRVRDGLAALERADRLLEHRPRRLTVHRARVSAAAQRGRRGDREVQRPAGDHGRAGRP